MFALLIAGLSACGGSSTGPDHGKAPKTPDLDKAQPDVSFFTDNNPQKKNPQLEETTNFHAARSVAIGGSFTLALGSIYGSIFYQANDEDAEFKDGQWVWSYSYAGAAGSFEYKSTAKELSNGSTKWALYYSINSEDVQINDYKWMEGTVSADGSQGNWIFNEQETDTNNEVPYLKSEWDITSDNEKTLSLKTYDQGSLSSTISYEQDGANFTMTFSDAGETNDQVLTWNTDTNVGFYTDSGTKKCWDENFQNTTCP